MTEKPDSHREGTDEALMVRYQRGDRNALAVIVRRYVRQVYATAYGITGATNVAAELTESAFLALVGQAGSFHIEMRFRSWLFGFLHQLVLERFHASSEALSAAGSPAAAGLAEEVSPLGSARSPRSQLLSRRISECVEKLPLLEREAVVMKLTAQLTLSELGAATGADGDTVRTRLRFALERLRESISGTEEFARALR